jgi:inward rectifier potassium channel
MSWTRFNIVIALYFILINLLFATMYYFTGIEGLQGVQGTTAFDRYLEAFFFSTQTLSTVGFGRLSPAAHLTSTIAAIESVFGLLGFALATGLLYARFSRPVARLRFSTNALIAPFREGRAFQFRIVNRISNGQISDMECRVSLAKIEVENGIPLRRFRPLELEVKRALFFPMVWTVNHPIDENSPLYGMTEKQLHECQAEFLINLSGFDDTFSQTVNKRFSYTADELVFGAKFKTLIQQNENGETVQDLRLLSDYEMAPLP